MRFDLALHDKKLDLPELPEDEESPALSLAQEQAIARALEAAKERKGMELKPHA